MKRSRSFAAVATVALAAGAAVAEPMPRTRPTPIEVTALPEYCQARFGDDTAARNMWARRLGTQHFQHIHHHCTGLSLLNRSMVTIDRNTKRFYLQSAVGEFNYVLARWPKDFALTAEAEQGKARAAGMLQAVPSSRKY